MEGILIPVKPIADAKKRLALGLSESQRRRLQLAMLADVLRATEKWDLRVIVTSDPDAEAVAMAFGCRLERDPGLGLNEAIDAGTHAAITQGCSVLLVIPADIPLLTGTDVVNLFSQDVDVAVVPSRDGGTNALLRRPPSIIKPAFGKNSSEQHLRNATKAGLRAGSIALPSVILDIDAPSDLEELARRNEERESIRVARELLNL